MTDLTSTLPLDAARLWNKTTILKWVASIFQIMGYGATAFGLNPLNIYLFFGGLIGWFIVGVLWRDRAIMLIHVVALAAMITGLLSA
ncbi:DUF6552 family protein [Sulfitobacter sp. JB4-11]|uniref:DUF6552 family protein n=1 Tax=Sulfitobacter rhodophyticola TaxID=3238304 RepID=UPI003515D359